jgi:uncharacterized DUF497 family protein
VRFEWDEGKEGANREKHGVSFVEAQELFVSGTDYLEIYDQEHSDTEERFIAVGPIARGLVVIVWTERDDGTVRIISARWATPKERELYRHYMEQHQ